MKVGHWIAGLAAAAFLVAGCGGNGQDTGAGKGDTAATESTVSEKAEGVESHPAATKAPHLKKLRVTLDGTQGAENVGILMAAKHGYFEDVGLDVWVGAPLEPNRPVSYVAKGTDDLGVAQEPQVVIGREKGKHVVAVGSLIARPTAAMIWLQGSKIHGIADLKGKTIAIPGVPFQEAFLEAVLAQAGLTLKDVEVKKVAYELAPALISGRADAIFGGSPNLVGPELKVRGEKPVVTPVRDLGIPAYEEFVVIARTGFVKRHPKLIRGFMSAVARGTAAAVKDPEGAVNAVVEAIGAQPETHRPEKVAQMGATLPLLSRSGRMSPDRAQALVGWMYEEGLIEQRLSAEKLLANAHR